MEVEIKETGPISRRVIVKMPKKRVDAEFKEFFDAARQQIEVRGFRKGQATDEALKARLGPTVNAEVSSRLVYAGVSDAVRDYNLAVAGNPMLIEEHRASDKRKFVGEFGLDGSFRFEVDIDVEPEIDITDYKGVEVAQPTPDIEGWVNEKLYEYQEMFADREPITDRPAEKGDEVSLDFEGFIDGEPIPNSKGELETIVLGQGGLIDGFEENIVGKSAEENFEFQIKFPDDYGNPNIAGKEAVFKCYIHAITKVELHPLNDELAELVVFENLEALKEDLRKRAEEEFMKPVRAQILEEIINKLIEKHPFEVPPGWLEMETRVVAQRLGMQQVPTDPALLAQLKEIAFKVVKQNYILDKVYAKEESIHLSADDIHQRLTEEGEKLGETAEEYLTNLRNSQNYEGFVAFYEHQRAIDFLIDNAVVKEVENG